MIDPIMVMGDLDGYARELDTLSKELADVEDRLRPATLRYEKFMGDFEAGLWEAHVQDGDKFPREELCVRLAHRAMPPDVWGSYANLIAERKRMEKRIGSLKAIVDAKRSVLSALKTEMEATR